MQETVITAKVSKKSNNLASILSKYYDCSLRFLQHVLNYLHAACHSSCLRRCTGSTESDCCDVFTNERVCASSCPAINQVAVEANDYICSK